MPLMLTKFLFDHCITHFRGYDGSWEILSFVQIWYTNASSYYFLMKIKAFYSTSIFKIVIRGSNGKIDWIKKMSPFFMHQSLKSKRKSVLISLSLSSRFFEQLIISSIHFHERPLAIALSTYLEKIRPPGGGLGWGKAKFQLFFKSIFTQPVNGRFFTTYLK